MRQRCFGRVLAMASKAARRRKRAQQRERAEQDALERAHEESFACAEFDLARIEALIDEAGDVLDDVFEVADDARKGWPLTPETDELCAVFDAAKAAVRDCRERLGAVHTRAAQCRNDDLHLHVARGQVERMVRAADVPVRGGDAPRDSPDDDIPC